MASYSGCQGNKFFDYNAVQKLASTSCLKSNCDYLCQEAAHHRCGGMSAKQVGDYSGGHALSVKGHVVCCYQKE